MPMVGLVVCDHCGESKKVKGNLSKAVEYFTGLGWNVNKVVECPNCVKSKSVPVSGSKPVEVYTDGSCVGSNPGYGGWGWVDDTGRRDSGAAVDHPTTSQRMELTAVVEALESHSDPIKLFTDSQYVSNCVNKKWYKGWLKNQWRTSNGGDVKNRDLWEALLNGLSKHPNIVVEWVKGHADNELNNVVDELARTAARAGMSKRRNL